MPTVRKKKEDQFFTVDDLYRMKERLDGAWYELDQGALLLCEPSGLEHADLGMQLAIRLGSYVYAHRLGRVLGADGAFVLSRNPDTVRIPDVSFIRADRLPYGRLSQKFFEGAPDLAVEVMSPSDRFTSVEKKIDDYISAGTPLVWVIRPRDYMAIVQRSDGTSARLTTRDYFDGEEVVPGFTCRLGELFTG